MSYVEEEVYPHALDDGVDGEAAAAAAAAAAAETEAGGHKMYWVAPRGLAVV